MIFHSLIADAYMFEFYLCEKFSNKIQNVEMSEIFRLIMNANAYIYEVTLFAVWFIAQSKINKHFRVVRCDEVAAMSSNHIHMGKIHKIIIWEFIWISILFEVFFRFFMIESKQTKQ